MSDERTMKVIDETGRQLAIKEFQETDEGLILRWQTGSNALASNVPADHPDRDDFMVKVECNADRKTRNIVGQVIKVVAFLAHVVELTDKATGELRNKVRIVLLCDDGTTVSTTAGQPLRMISRIAKKRPEYPWMPPVEIETFEHAIEDGKSYCEMREAKKKVAPAKAK